MSGFGEAAMIPVPDSKALKEQGAQLRVRRTALGFTRGQMAAGIGIPLREVHEIERGTASDAMSCQYVDWVTTMEKWPADVREEQLKLARNSERFRQYRAAGSEG